MTRITIDLDDDACRRVMDRFHLVTKREAVNFALRSVAGEPVDVDAARRMRGIGWDADLDKVRSNPNS